MFNKRSYWLTTLATAAMVLAGSANAQEYIHGFPDGVLHQEGEIVLGDPELGVGMGPACCSPFGRAYDVYAPCHFPRYFAHVENLWLKRDTGENVVFLQGVNAGDVFALGTRELTFNLEPGVRTSIGFALNCHTYIEASYFGLHDWRLNNFAVAGGPLTITGGATGLLTTIGAQSVDYGSSLHSAEINLRTFVYVYPHMSLLIGFRYLNFLEDFTVTESGLSGVAPATAFVFKSTTNNMFGVHFGADTEYQFGEMLGVGINSKLGLLSNQGRADVFQSIDDSAFGPLSLRTSESGTDFCISLEMAAAATLQVTNNLAVRGGYQMLYLSKAALAPEQVAPPIGSGLGQILEDNTNVLFHGPFLGVIVKWGACD